MKYKITYKAQDSDYIRLGEFNEETDVIEKWYNEHYELLYFGSMDGTPMIMDGVDEGSRFTTIVYRDKNKQVFSVTLKHGQRTARKLDDGETETLFNKDELKFFYGLGWKLRGMEELGQTVEDWF
mgnify:CR=1 FL=1